MANIKYKFSDEEVKYIQDKLKEPAVIRGFFKLVDSKPKTLHNLVDEAGVNGVMRTLVHFEKYINKIIKG